MFKRKYENPIISFNPKRWPECIRNAFMRFNIIANIILPVWLLNLLNSNPTSREYKKKIRAMKRKV